MTHPAHNERQLLARIEQLEVLVRRVARVKPEAPEIASLVGHARRLLGMPK